MFEIKPENVQILAEKKVQILGSIRAYECRNVKEELL